MGFFTFMSFNQIILAIQCFLSEWLFLSFDSTWKRLEFGDLVLEKGWIFVSAEFFPISGLQF